MKCICGSWITNLPGSEIKGVCPVYFCPNFLVILLILCGMLNEYVRIWKIMKVYGMINITNVWVPKFEVRIF
jgi:hypothetical protein